MSDEPQTKKKLPGVADTAALVGLGLLGTCAVLGILGLVLPWWTGGSSLGQLANSAVTGSTVSLWDLKLDIGKQAPDGAGGTTLKIERQDMTWSQLCKIAAQTDGEPAACGQVTAVRAFTILTAIFALAGAGSLHLARSVTPLLLLLGALLALITGVWAILAILVGVMISTSGLQGGGVISCLVAVVLSFTAISAAFYAANIAMPAEGPPKKHRFTRQQRVQVQREKDLEVAEQMQSKVRAHRLAGETESTQSGCRKPPEMLKKILKFTEENSGETDSDEIPQEWLEKAFEEIDSDRSGQIEISELVECLNLCGLNAGPEVAECILKEIDKNMSGDIDIHEFVEFFRSIEELGRFEAKTEQRAHFTQLLCNCCFISHIIIVSILLMNFINMNEADDPDNYLIFKNMLMAFSLVLGLLLLNVICLPAIRLTLGANLAAWKRQYDEEVAKRFARRKKPKEEEETQGSHLAWSTGHKKADGLTELTVNAAVFGTSYRVSKQNFFQAPPQPEVGSRAGRRNESRQASKAEGNSGAGSGGVLATTDGGFERYKPEAYWQAALRSKEAQVPSSFSPMQVRDMDMPRPQPEMPGQLALQNTPALPGGLTGTGFYHREL